MLTALLARIPLGAIGAPADGLPLPLAASEGPEGRCQPGKPPPGLEGVDGPAVRCRDDVGAGSPNETVVLLHLAGGTVQTVLIGTWAHKRSGPSGSAEARTGSSNRLGG